MVDALVEISKGLYPRHIISCPLVVPALVVCRDIPSKASYAEEVSIVMRIDEVDFNGIEQYFGVKKIDPHYTFEKFLDDFLWESVTKYLVDYDSIVEDWNKYQAFTNEECMRFRINPKQWSVVAKHIEMHRHVEWDEFSLRFQRIKFNTFDSEIRSVRKSS